MTDARTTTSEANARRLQAEFRREVELRDKRFDRLKLDMSNALEDVLRKLDGMAKKLTALEVQARSSSMKQLVSASMSTVERTRNGV